MPGGFLGYRRCGHRDKSLLLNFNESSAEMIFYNFVGARIPQRVHITVMNCEYQVLKFLIVFKTDYLQACLFALFNLKMSVVLLAPIPLPHLLPGLAIFVARTRKSRISH